jgi:hypothetical protein
MTERLPKSMLRARRQATVCPQTSKVGYRSKRKALKFAERSTQITGLRLYVYDCRFCDRWHMTSQVARTKAGR